MPDQYRKSVCREKIQAYLVKSFYIDEKDLAKQIEDYTENIDLMKVSVLMTISSQYKQNKLSEIDRSE